MKINEITRSGELKSAKGKKKFGNSILYQEIDFEKIFKVETATNNFYYTIDDNDFLTALVTTTKNNELIRFENISGRKGLITIILFAILKNEGELRILPTEEVTYPGLKWLLDAVRFNKYFSLIDYNNQPISRMELEDDWMNETEKIGIIFVVKDSLLETIDRYQKEHQRYKDNQDTLIMPMLKWIGDKDLL